MNRGIKTLGIVFSLLLLSVLLIIMLIGAPYLTLPFGIRRTEFLRNSLAHDFFRQYLFWVAALFSIVLILVILVLIFYPKANRSFVLKEEQGHLAFDKRAIEGFVRSKLSQVGFVDSPRINVRATKSKIKVNIKGQLNRTSSHIGKTGTLMKEIQRELQDILGSQKKVYVDVAYKSFNEEDTSHADSQPRVE